MKRILVVLVLVLLLLGISGCKEAPPPDATPESPTEGDVLAAYSTAAEAYSWFNLMTMPLDPSDSHQAGDGVYDRVEVPGITSLSELKDYLNTLFAPELTDSLLALSSGHYQDFGGVLYARSADRGQNLFLQDKQVEASQKDDTHWEVTLTFYADTTDYTDPAALQVTIGYSQSVLDYDKTDSGWRFTSFCPVDNLDLNADTVYTFTYDFDLFSRTDFDDYSDFQLCCYLLKADGAFAEGPSDLLARRFLKNPENIVSVLSVVHQGPWKNKDVLIPSVGYSAAAWFTDGERTEFEEILDSDTAAQSDAGRAVISAISAAYDKSMAEQESNKVTSEQEFSLAPLSEDTGHNTLRLGLQEGSFPWGFQLSGTPQALSGGDTYGAVYQADCGNLALYYSGRDDGQQYLYSMITEDASPATSLWTHRGARCGLKEEELQQYYPNELTYLDADHVGPSYSPLGVEYDGAWVYEPGGEAYCKHILFFMKAGAVTAIEVADLMDGRILN